VDSGLGTFRGNQKGVWAGLEAVGLAYEEICQPKWFREEPHLGWAFWNFCHEAYQATVPHDGYVRAREWGQRCPLGFFSFTSNIDSHWITSGTSGDRMLEVHGAVRWLQCSKPCCPDVWKAPKDLGLVEDEVTHRVRGILPTCPKCKAVARPNVQMFGGDTGFSKARRGAQFSRYDAWLKHLEARPDRDSIRITCVEVGSGLTVPTVRNELEAVVKKFPQARLIRVNPENPGLSTELADRGVSLPLRAGFAIEELNQHVFKQEDVVTFVLWGNQGGCEIRAPYGTCLGRLLRLAEMEDGISVEFTKETKAVSWGYGGRRQDELRLHDCCSASNFSEVKAAEGPELHVTVVLTVQANFRNEKHPSNLGPVLLRRVEQISSLLSEMNSMFQDDAYQEQAHRCTNRRDLMQLLRTVQFVVLPKYGIEASEKGTLIMAAWIGSAQHVPEVQHQVDKSMELSHAAKMSYLPAVEKPKAKEPQGPPPPEPMQVVCRAMPNEDGEESGDTFPIEATNQTSLWEIRARLAEALSWDADTAKAVRFLAKAQGHNFVGLKDNELARQTLYLRNSPPLRANAPVEVTFKEMAPEEGQVAKTFALQVLADDSVAQVREKLGGALGWDEKARRRARFLIRLNKESFGALKEQERVQARKLIYVHGAPVEPTPEAAAALAHAACGPARTPRPPQPEVEVTTEEEQLEESSEEIEVVVHLPGGMDLKIPLTVKKGSTVLSLKVTIAETDPTQRTTIDAFWLAPLGKKSAPYADNNRLWEACDLEVTTELPPGPRAPSPRASLPAAPPVQTYFIAGSWTDYKPMKMTRDGTSFVHTMKMSQKGVEHFQILLGGSWDATYYPSIKDAHPHVKHELRGPDNQGHGMNWQIGAVGSKAGKNSVKVGARIKIVLAVDEQHVPVSVTWKHA